MLNRTFRKCCEKQHHNNLVSLRITSRVSPAQMSALEIGSRFKTKYTEKSYLECFKLVMIPSVFGFVLTSYMWFRSDELSLSTISGWRLLAHLGPYQVPSLLNTGKWETSLDRLSRAEELGLTESELSQLLTDIEVITQRRHAVCSIVKKHGFSKIFLPVMKNLSSIGNDGITGQSHFESNLRVAMDIVCATPAKDRRVPIETIENLVSSNTNSWESIANEEVMRFREYRAILLLKLLQNTDNAKDATSSTKILNFLINEKNHSQHIKYSTLPIVPLLYQFKTEKLGYEYADIIWRIERLIEKTSSGGGADKGKIPERKSLSLETKLDLQNFEKLVYMTICYSSLRLIPSISEYTIVMLKAASLSVMRAVFGAIVLDFGYRIEEHIIQSTPYYEVHDIIKNQSPSSSSSAAAVVTALIYSGIMVMGHSALGAAVLRLFPYSIAPFALIRLRDSFTDSFRFM